MSQMDSDVLKELLRYTSKPVFKYIENRVKNFNDVIYKELDLITQEINSLKQQLTNIQSKKETYLDSLISNQFSGQERQVINDKIQEFSLKEKQFNAEIYKKEFLMTRKEDDLLSIDELKKELVFLKINHAKLTPEKLHQWIQQNMKQITYHQNYIFIQFKLIGSIYEKERGDSMKQSI